MRHAQLVFSFLGFLFEEKHKFKDFEFFYKNTYFDAATN